MKRYRLLSLKPSPNMIIDWTDKINQSMCMIERLPKAEKPRMNRRNYKGYTFYSVYPELLGDDWLKSVIETIQSDKSGNKFLIVRR